MSKREKLTDLEVKMIRVKYFGVGSEETYRSLGAEFGISSVQVGKIIRGESRKEVK